MLVYNQDKTKLLKDFDREKGFLISDTMVVHHEADEQRDAYDETLNICVYVPYSEKQLRIREYQKEMNRYQDYLASTDYLVIKLVEGLITETEYEQYKPLRQEAREKVNEYKKLLEKEGELQ